MNGTLRFLFTHVGKQPRSKKSPGKRRQHGEASTAAAATGGAVSRLSEDPLMAYLHALVGVAVGSFVSCGEGGLASGTLAAGVGKHVSFA